MRAWILLSLVFLPALTLPAQTKSVKDLFDGPDATPTPSANTAANDETPPATDPSVAQVNSREISQQAFLKLLYASAGTRILRQLVGLELAKQMATAQGVDPGKTGIDRELRFVVEELGPEKDALGKTLSFNDRQRLLRGIIERRGMSYEEFQVGIEQQAYLRAIARPKVKITEPILQEEFERAYGKKRVVRAIVVPDIQVGQEVFHHLQKGEKFEALAGKYSVDFDSAPIGGQLGEIGLKDPKLPPVVVQTVFAMPVGKFSSPIRVENQVWIIKVEREVPPMSITLAKVRDQLADRLQRQREDQMMAKIQTELFRSAKIKVNDKLLAKDFGRWLKELQSNNPK